MRRFVSIGTFVHSQLTTRWSLWCSLRSRLQFHSADLHNSPRPISIDWDAQRWVTRLTTLSDSFGTFGQLSRSPYSVWSFIGHPIRRPADRPTDRSSQSASLCVVWISRPMFTNRLLFVSILDQQSLYHAYRWAFILRSQSLSAAAAALCCISVTYHVGTEAGWPVCMYVANQVGGPSNDVCSWRSATFVEIQYVSNDTQSTRVRNIVCIVGLIIEWRMKLFATEVVMLASGHHAIVQ